MPWAGLRDDLKMLREVALHSFFGDFQLKWRLFIMFFSEILGNGVFFFLLVGMSCCCTK